MAMGEAPVFATIERKRGRDGILRPTGRPLNPRMVTRVFRRYAERAGLPCTIRLHDLRHTAITNAISQGEDILLIAAFAGHAKTSTTVDVYGHLMPDRVRAAAQRMRSVSGDQAAGDLDERTGVVARCFVRELDATSPYRLSAAAANTPRSEQSTPPLTSTNEHAQTDPGARISHAPHSPPDDSGRAPALPGRDSPTGAEPLRPD